MDAMSHDPETGEVLTSPVATINIAGAAGQLKSIVQRIERVAEEIADLQDDMREIYKEARMTGFDPKIIRKVVAERKKDGSERQAELDLFRVYFDAAR